MQKRSLRGITTQLLSSRLCLLFRDISVEILAARSPPERSLPAIVAFEPPAIAECSGPLFTTSGDSVIAARDLLPAERLARTNRIWTAIILCSFTREVQPAVRPADASRRKETAP